MGRSPVSEPAAGRSHKLSSRMPLLTARPAVAFPASQRHRPWRGQALAVTNLYGLENRGSYV